MSGAGGALSPLQKAALVVRDLRERVRVLEAASGREAVAVIGLGCRLPGADDPEAYWRLLESGGDATGDVPAGRWDAAPLLGSGRLATGRGGFLGGVPEAFDAGFFGIAPREARSIDPQQRLLLEVAWEALEDAGVAGEVGGGVGGSATGVFVGISMIDYARRLLDRPASQIDAYGASGSLHSVASGRISFSFDLVGPSLSVDTACSSSLVAVHLAVRALRAGECSMALAGGVNLLLAPELSVTFSAARMLSPDGRCKAFDASADGYGRAEGCGVVVLKRLSDARAAGDRVLAVIRGSAVNQDGATSGLTVPNGPAQAAVIRAALADAGVEAGAVGLIEAHGTGTSLGDPIEMGALRDVFAGGRSAGDPLWVGSAKTNIGHAEGAAGVAGLIKLVLALRHRTMPGHLHLRAPSPLIDWAGGALAVPVAARGWTERLVGGVSSFGFSGTNAHVVVEAAEAEGVAVAPGPGVYVVSGKDAGALEAGVAAHAAALAGGSVPWGSAWRMAGAGRSHFSHRVAVVADDAVEAARLLAVAPRGRVAAGGRARVAFLFTGQGSVVPGMGLDLPAAGQAVLDEADVVLAGALGRPLRAVLGDAALLARTDHAQPALYAVQCALVACWRGWGILPAWVLGHSVGEYAAGYAAGVFDFAAGLRLVLARGLAMQGSPAGGMVAVALDAGAAGRLIAGEADVAVAAENGPGSTVLSGPVDALRRVVAGMDVRWLEVSHGFHSPLMRGAAAAFRGAFAGVALRAPRVSFVRTGGAGEVTDPEYWVGGIEAPVRFGAGMAQLGEASAFVEVGARPVLLGLGRRCLPDGDRAWVPSLVPGVGAERSLLAGVAALHVRGVAVAFPRGPVVTLPTYPWQRTAMSVPAWVRDGVDDPLVPRRVDSPLPQWLFATRLAQDSPGFLGSHRVGGEVVVPLAVMMALMRACGEVESIEAGARLVLDGARDVQVVVDPAAGSMALHSRGRGAWTLHATGRLGRAEARGGEGLAAWRARCADPGDAGAFRAEAARAGVVLEPPFDGVRALWRGEGAALGRVAVEAGAPGCVVLDGCLQVAACLLPGGRWLPVGVEGWAASGLPDEVWAGARLAGPGRVEVEVMDAGGAALGTATVIFRADADDVGDLLYSVGWEELPWAVDARLGTLPSAAAGVKGVLGSPEGAEYAAALAEVERLAAAYARVAVTQVNAVGAGRRLLFDTVVAMAGAAEVDPAAEQARLGANPAVRAELALLGRCGPALAGVIEGRVDPLALLFPGGGDGDALALYSGSVWARAMGAGLAGAVRDVVARRGGGPLRVLEIGGGTGATTALLLPLLPAGGEYVFTDVSARFTRAAQGRFAGVVARPLDIERDPAQQGFAAGSFDLVVAANVLHATVDLAVSLRHAAWLLAPGGVLGLIEGTGRLGWGDLTFGLTEGWWRFRDRDVRTDHPMVGVAAWRGLLRDAGFGEVVAVDAADHANGRQFAQAVIVARREVGAGAWLVAGDAGLAGAMAAAGATVVDVPGPGLRGVVVAGNGLRAAVEALRRWMEADVPVWFVTRAGAEGSALRGLMRAAKRERPGLDCAVLELPAAPDALDLADAARVVLAGRGGEDELAIRAGRLLGARVRASGAPPLVLQGGAFRFSVGSAGLVDSVAAEAMDVPVAEPGEVVVETRAVGLNFRDVLLAMDLYPGGGALGQECSGVVVSAGAGVALRVGEAVMAVAPGAMASHVRIPAALAVAVPEGVDMAQAAALPVALVTAVHALEDVARVRAGETVLVHAAASGTGMACLRVARGLGARVFATASAGKRGTVEGAEAVFDSRSTGFGAAVLAATGGRGVDVVVNALSGPGFVEAGLAALAPGGRFVELGRRGVLSAAEVARVRPDVRYACLDLAREAAGDPAVVGGLLRRVAEWVRSGRMAALPVRRFPMEEAGAALRVMELGRQVGKLVLTRAPGPAVYRGTWLITGGLGGLGRAVAGWLLGRGVERVVLVGRHGGEAGLAGAEVRVANVRDRAALGAVVEEIGPALRGVVHAAGVLDDGPLASLEWARFETVLGAKVEGARHLHELTAGCALDAFVLFGSAVSLLGNAGQANHAAANAWLDGLSRERHALGLPSVCIQWGPWAEVGAAAGSLDALARLGLGAMTVEQGLAAFGRALERNEPVVAAAAIDWPVFLGSGGGSRFFPGVGGGVAVVAEAGGETVLARVTAVVAGVLGLATLEPGARFFEVGMDSLTAIEARHRLERAFGCKLDSTVALDHPTPEALARHIEGVPEPEPELDEDNIEARLMQRLAALE